MWATPRRLSRQASKEEKVTNLTGSMRTRGNKAVYELADEFLWDEPRCFKKLFPQIENPYLIRIVEALISFAPSCNFQLPKNSKFTAKITKELEIVKKQVKQDIYVSAHPFLSIDN
jgi:hypothetical protein